MADEQHIQWLLEGVEAWNAGRWDEGHELYELEVDLVQADFNVVFRDVVKDGQIPLAGYDLANADLIEARLINANLAGANLAGASLNRALLDKANLASANLASAILDGASLTKANLAGAKLENAGLSGTDLSGANLAGANLESADLSGADLTGANLAEASLTKANVSSATCTCADFRHTNLVAANLSDAKIWQGILFVNINESPEPCADVPDCVGSIKDVIDMVNMLKLYHNTDDGRFTVYFRGESKSEWELRPSVMRDISYKKHERDMLYDLIAKRPGDFNGIVSGVGQLVLAQHHGLKTRFLDITRNPLVALFHACENEQHHCENEQHHCENAKLHVFVTPRDMVKPFISDTVSIIANYARLPEHHQKALTGHHNDKSNYLVALRQLFQPIQSEKPYFESLIDPKDFYRVIIVEPQQSSERVIKQAGAFLVSAFHERFEREYIEARGEGVPPLYAHYQMTIPCSAKETILEELKMLDITRESLFPGLDESARAVNESYSERSE